MKEKQRKKQVEENVNKENLSNNLSSNLVLKMPNFDFANVGRDLTNGAYLDQNKEGNFELEYEEEGNSGDEERIFGKYFIESNEIMCSQLQQFLYFSEGERLL